MRVEFLHLKSIVMGRIKTVAHGRVAYSYAYQSDLEPAASLRMSATVWSMWCVR